MLFSIEGLALGLRNLGEFTFLVALQQFPLNKHKIFHITAHPQRRGYEERVHSLRPIKPDAAGPRSDARTGREP